MSMYQNMFFDYQLFFFLLEIFKKKSILINAYLMNISLIINKSVELFVKLGTIFETASY